MTALLAHMKRLWPRYTFAPALPFFLWPLYLIVRGEARWETFAVMILGCVLPYVSFTTKRLFQAVAPIGWVGVLYDSMRFFKNDSGNPDAYYEPNSFGGPAEDPSVKEPPLRSPYCGCKRCHGYGWSCLCRKPKLRR